MSNKDNENTLKSKKKRHGIYFLIFLALILIPAIWKLSNITSGPKPLTSEEIAIIIQQEKSLIDKFNSRDLQAYEETKQNLVKDFNKLFENIKDKKKACDDLRKIIAANPNTPEEQIKRLSYSKARAGVAANPQTPVKILQRLSEDIDEEVRANVAGNPSTPDKVLKQLSSDTEEKVLVKLASNPKTQYETLLDLSRKNDSDINLSLAGNPNVPNEVLNNFLYGKGGGFLTGCDLLITAFANPKINKDTLKQSHKNESKCVRKGIALNQNVSIDLLNLLSKDKEKSVREAVSKNSVTPSNILLNIMNYEEDGWLSTPRDLTFGNPNMPENIVREYSQKEDNKIRKNIALNPSLPEDIFTTLFDLDDKTINKALACNPSCPIEILGRLSEKKYTREYVANNPRCPTEILTSLLNSPDKEAGVEGFVDEISGCWGINPTFIAKWGKDVIGKDANDELKEYIQMVFADNLFTTEELIERINEIYQKNIFELQDKLKAHRNNLLTELINDLTSNPNLMEIKLLLDKESFSSFYKQSLDEISSKLVKASTVQQLALAATTYDLIRSIIMPIAKKVLQMAANKMSTRAVSALAESTSDNSGDWKIKALRITTEFAIIIAIDIYSEYQLKKKINDELDKIKEKILLGTDHNKGLINSMNEAVETYIKNKDEILVKALKKAVTAIN